MRKQLLEYKIETGIHYFPNHLLKFFQNSEIAPLNTTQTHYENILSLPLHADLDLEDVDYVADILIKLLA